MGRSIKQRPKCAIVGFSKSVARLLPLLLLLRYNQSVPAKAKV